MKKYRIVSGFILVVFIFVYLITASAAWFASFITVHTEGEFTASSIASYFADGDGTEGDPYIISNAKHLYNLAWLQNKNALGENKTYFKVCEIVGTGDNVQHVPTTIDMAGAISGVDEEGRSGAIPPIGTYEYPFLGYFDGFGSTISNLWVSTVKDDWKEQPEGVGDYTSKYVGLFGAIGGDAIIEDFVLDTVEVTTHVNGAKVGIICGYVNAMVRNVGVYNGIISVVDGATCTSNYSLLGEKDARIVWDDMPKVDSQYEDTTSGSSGWGGSLDMLELNKRMTYIVGASPDVAKNTYTNYSIDYLNFVGTFYGTGSAYKAASKFIYFAKNTILPLNIDGNMLSDEISGNNGSVTTNEYKNASEKETVSASNTGYLVGGGKAGSSADIRLRAYTITSGSYNGIYKSLGTAKVTNGTFDGANFEMLTVTPKGETYVIGDKYNVNASTGLTSYAKKMYSELGFTQYCKFEGEKDNGVRMAIVNTLQGQTLFHGIHFMPRIDTSALNTTIFDAEIGNKTLKNYEAIDGALNFTVQNSGTITAIAATNFSQSGSHSLFYLYKVERNADNSISNVVEIKTIHKNLNPQNGELLYAYNLSNADSSKYTLLYDSSTMNKLKEAGAAYYFEIPVNAGDYAIGCKTDDSAGAYLMYLDIGANGGESSTVQRPTNPGEFATIMYDVDYVISPTTDISADSYVNHQSLLKINSASSGSKIYYLAAGPLNESTVYYCTGGADITDIAAQTPKKSAPKNRGDTFEGTSFSDRTETK